MGSRGTATVGGLGNIPPEVKLFMCMRIMIVELNNLKFCIWQVGLIPPTLKFTIFALIPLVLYARAGWSAPA